MSKNSLYVHVVLDNSGSMLRAKSQTLTALNKYLDDLQDDAVVSLNRFGLRSERLRTKVNKAAAKITPDEYPCNSGTALYDAIGKAISEVDAEAKDFDRIALVIQTDGQELDSKEFTFEAVKQLLDDKQNGEGWLIVFLGAGLSAVRAFRSLGATPDLVMDYSHAAPEAAFNASSRATAMYASASTRSVGRLKAAFTDDERKKSR